jgi:hypothetical protein
MDIHEEIAFFLWKEKVMSGTPWDAFLDATGLAKHKDKEQPTEAEELARQHRSDVLTHLTDFSSVWPKPEMIEVAPGQFATGVKEVYGPKPQDLTEYRAAQARKDAVTLSGDGFVAVFDGNLFTLRTPNGIVQLSLQQYNQLQQLIANAPSTTQEVPTAYGYQGGSPVVSSSSYAPDEKHFPSQNELVFAQSSAAKQNEERRRFVTEMAYKTGRWGAGKGD